LTSKPRVAAQEWMSVLLIDQSEHCVEPDFLLVHDPTEFGALDDLPTEKEQLLQDFLFRELPDVGRLREQHSRFVDALRQHARVVYLSELLDSSGSSVATCSLRANHTCIRHVTSSASGETSLLRMG